MTKIFNDLVTANFDGLPFHLILSGHSVLHNNADTVFSFGFCDSLLSCLSCYFCDCSLLSPPQIPLSTPSMLLFSNILLLIFVFVLALPVQTLQGNLNHSYGFNCHGYADDLPNSLCSS